MSFAQRMAIALVAISVCSPAFAQSTRERVYGNLLSRKLEMSWHEVSTVQQPAPGVQVQFDGLRITRARFASAEEALAWASTSKDLTQNGLPGPTVVEVRGNQVLLVQGHHAADTTIVRKALRQGWDYLRGGDANRSLIAVAEGDGHLAARTPLSSGPLYEAIRNAVDSARQNPERVASVGGAHRFEGGGTVSAFRRSGSGGAFAIGGDPAQLEGIIDRLEALTGGSLGLDRVVSAPSERTQEEPTTTARVDTPREITSPMGSGGRTNSDWGDDWSDDGWDEPRAPTRRSTTTEGGLPEDVNTSSVTASSGETLTYRNGEPTSIPLQVAEPGDEPIDLSGTWSVPVGPEGVPGSVRFANRQTGEDGQDTYDVTVVVREGENTESIELEARFDGETLTTRVKPDDRNPQELEPRDGATAVLDRLFSDETPSQEPRAEQEEEQPEEEGPEGRYTVEIATKDITFTAEGEVDPEGPTPVESFRRFNDPDVICPGEFEAMEEVIWANPNPGNRISSSARIVYGKAVPGANVTHRIFVSSQADRDNLDFYLAREAGQSLSRVTYVIFGPWGGYDGTVWVRDFGPIVTKRKSDGIPVVGDMGYFSSRPNDDMLPKGYAYLRNWGHRDVNRLKLEGGNFISDGKGRVFLTNQGIDANGSQEEVEDYLFELGAKEVIWFERMPGWEGTGHIDMFAKLVDANRVLVTQGGRAAGILDRNAAKFAELGYEVIRLPAADGPDLRGTDGQDLQSYSNSLFLNGVALVPTYGDAAKDAQALQIYRDLGFNTIGADSRGLIVANGAIHCISMQIPKVGE